MVGTIGLSHSDIAAGPGLDQPLFFVFRTNVCDLYLLTVTRREERIRLRESVYFPIKN
jgi:hypothetical protein